jgi:hypothetical protein
MIEEPHTRQRKIYDFSVGNRCVMSRACKCISTYDAETIFINFAGLYARFVMVCRSCRNRINRPVKSNLGEMLTA